MKTIQQFFSTLPLLMKGFGFIFRNKMQWFLLIPFIINIILYMGGFFIMESVFHSLQSYFEVSIKSYFSDGMFRFVSGFLHVLIQVLYFLLFLIYGGFLMLMVLSPVLSYISEKTEKIVTGKDSGSFKFTQFLNDFWRGLKLTFRNMFLETGILILMFFIGFIPVINLFIPIVLFFVTAYFYGFSFMDYQNERNGLTVKESIAFVRNNKGLAAGSGAIFTFALMIPIIGAALGGMVSIAFVVAITVKLNNQHIKR